MLVTVHLLMCNTYCKLHFNMAQLYVGGDQLTVTRAIGIRHTHDTNTDKLVRRLA